MYIVKNIHAETYSIEYDCSLKCKNTVTIREMVPETFLSLLQYFQMSSATKYLDTCAMSF